MKQKITARAFSKKVNETFLKDNMLQSYVVDVHLVFDENNVWSFPNTPITLGTTIREIASGYKKKLINAEKIEAEQLEKEMQDEEDANIKKEAIEAYNKQQNTQIIKYKGNNYEVTKNDKGYMIESHKSGKSISPISPMGRAIIKRLEEQ